MKKYLINLIPPKEQSFFDRVVYFSLHYLRYVLVITQIVVIAVFFFRLKIDQEIVDLDESFKQKKEIINVFQPIVQEGQKTNFKVTETDNIIQGQENLDSLINYVLSRFPQSFYLKKMEIEDGKMSLIGYSLDSRTIKQFYNRLEKEKKFEKVDLKDIKKSIDGFNFSFYLAGFNPSLEKQ